MEIYVLNSAYSRIAVVDQYESFIWTERYNVYGDFQMVTPPTAKLKSLMIEGNYLAHSETSHIMQILSTHIVEDSDGSKSMTITGRSMVNLLNTRSIGPNRTDLSWVGNGTAASLAVKLVNDICIAGTGISVYDKIPDLSVTNNAPATDVIDISLSPQSLYNAVKDLCDSQKFGFEITLKKTSPRLAFRIYKGVLKPNVVFSSTLDNLTEEAYLKSIEEYKNIAYVWGLDNAKNTIVAAPGTSLTVTGLARRVMHVDASDIDPLNITDAEWAKALKQRGVEALAANKRVNLFDGKLTSVNPFKYGTHYNLGDIVTFQDEDGMKTQVTITEYIWGSDGEGLRSYPTFDAVE